MKEVEDWFCVLQAGSLPAAAETPRTHLQALLAPSVELGQRHQSGGALLGHHLRTADRHDVMSTGLDV